MNTCYEVQSLTFCDGWINTWFLIPEFGDSTDTDVPETIPTREAAQEALDEFLFDIQSEIDAGQRAADEGYEAEDFRIEEVQSQA